MEVCRLEDFMRGLKPWLSGDYIRRATLNEEGNFVLDFVDGVRNVYRIEDCTRTELQKIVEDLKSRGISVELTGLQSNEMP